MENLKYLLVIAMLFSGVLAQAQEAVAVPAVIETEEKEEDKLEISGFVDMYYQYNFNDNAAATTSFTDKHNSFELGMANVIFSKQFDKVGFVADLAFGPRANVANGEGNFTTDIIKQLFVTYTPVDKLTLTAGNFGTHIGYELIDAPGNFNYSTSYMFSNGPFFHTGIKADYSITDNIGAMVGLYNDTDSKSDFGGAPGKHLAAQLSYSDEKVGVYLNYLGGKEDSVSTGNQIDLTATFQAVDALLIGVNATTKSVTVEDVDEADSWFGAALYLNYSISDNFALGLRGEYFDDANALNYDQTALGLPVTGMNLMEYTLSANLTKGNLTFIPELRIDVASEDFFVDADGNATATSPTFILGAYYAF